MENSVEISKLGYFYYCYNEDAVLIHYLFDYKIVSGKRKVGFPIANLERVVNTLEEYKINYVLLDEKKVIKVRDFKKINAYLQYYQKALQKVHIEDRFRLIENKIKSMSNEQMAEFLETLEHALRE